MVMSSTSATDVSIQAVSPGLILSKPTDNGAVGAAASSAITADTGESATPRPIRREN
jgi:hypothetical protein